MRIETEEYKIQPSALRLAIGYRGLSQTELCRNVNGLSQPNLSKFLKGDDGKVSKDKLVEIMKFLQFPFAFIYQEFKPLQTSNGIIR